MPLRDHFHEPQNFRAVWTTVYGGLPAQITISLNRVLPQRYTAGPLVQSRRGLEIDVATYVNDCDESADFIINGNAVAAEVWAPPAPSVTLPAHWSAVDCYEVQIYDDSAERELVAAIELVSPSNKDRSNTRKLFVNKCAGLLQSGISVIIIDVVTDRLANLYAELLAALGQADPALPTPPQGIYAVSLRSRSAKQGQALEAWYHPLTIGQSLPTLPLWLAERLAVRLELEAIYQETLTALRIT